MTMRIRAGQKIGGIAALDARNLLRKCRIVGAKDKLVFRADGIEEELFKLACKLACKRKFGTAFRNCFYPDLFPKEKAAACRESARFIRNLVKEGFAEPDEPTRPADQGKCYWLTKSGEELCRAIAAKPVHRKSADEAIRGFMERVRSVNDGDRFLHRVTVVVLYGSYHRGAERPADVDLAIAMERKISDHAEYEKAHEEYLERHHEGKQLPTWGLFTPEHDVQTFLKNRQRMLSLHPLHDFIGMPKDENFGYEVLLGDNDTIAQMLAKGKAEREKPGSIVTKA